MSEELTTSAPEELTISVPEEFPSDAAPITLSQPALDAVRDILSAIDHEEGLEPYLRLYVAGGGCSGLQYGLGIDVTSLDPITESRFEQDGVPFVVDEVTLGHTRGSVIDYVYSEDALSGLQGRFKVDNPNATSGCGCGSSFRTAESGSVGCGSCPSRG